MKKYFDRGRMVYKKMIAENCIFEETCTKLHNSFFKKYPDDDLRKLVNMAMAALLKRKTFFAGAAAGWAAGIVYAVGSRGCGVPGVLNSELAAAFGISMSTIYKRAWAVRRLLKLR